MKREGNRSGRPEPEAVRILRLVGAAAAILAVLGIAIVVFWFIIRAPRF